MLPSMRTTPARPLPGTCLCEYAKAELMTAAGALGARAGRVHAGVHKARKAIRRTRATLALGESRLGAGAAILDRELRRLNCDLSALRDAHALVETLDRLGARPHDESIARLLRRARRIAAARRAAHLHDAEHAAVLDCARQRLSVLIAALPALPWDALSAGDCMDALARTQLRVATARDRACESCSDARWHRWRRRMRRLSQQRRACGAAGLDLTESLFDKSLAEQLGTMQDLSLLLEQCRRHSPFPGKDRIRLRAFAEAALTRQRERIASVGASR